MAPAAIARCRRLFSLVRMARFKFAIPLEAHWKVLARTMGHAEFADDPGFATIAGRCANRDACNTIVASWTAERGRVEVVEILDRAGIPVAPVNSYGDMTRDPHLFERNS